MTTSKVDCSAVPWGSVQWTMLCTLYIRAYESRAEHSILADHAAAEAVERIDYDFERIRRYVRPSANQYLVALRAKQFDLWAADFLDRHPDATVLHLGCGLDSRVFRLDPPRGVRWFDLDVPSVIDLRRQVYPEHENYRMLASSVTDPGWLAEIPTDSPVLVIAEGLLMYLTEAENRQLLRRLTDRFGSGELLFDVMAPWVVRIWTIYRWGLADPHEIERWNPRLTFVAQAATGANHAMIPSRTYRTLYRLIDGLPGVRTINRLLRYRF